MILKQEELLSQIISTKRGDSTQVHKRLRSTCNFIQMIMALNNHLILQEKYPRTPMREGCDDRHYHTPACRNRIRIVGLA